MALAGPAKLFGETDRISSGSANEGGKIAIGREFNRAAHLLATFMKDTIDFFARRAKKAAAEGRSPPQELEVSPRSELYLLVKCYLVESGGGKRLLRAAGLAPGPPGQVQQELQDPLRQQTVQQQ